MKENEEENIIRTIKTYPREKYVGQWVSGRLYPLYNIVSNNGSKFMSLSGKMKEEPYVIYDNETDSFYANEGWVIKEMSADSRITALGGGSSGGGLTPEDVEEMISGKQDAIDDLAAIRSGASSGATAYQKPSTGIPKTDLSTAVKNALDKAALVDNKQDIIDDLDTIRADAAAGATAYQKPSGGIPASDLASGVIPDISGKQDTLVSGTNIKTVNQNSLLGSGDITIANGEDGVGFESITTPATADGTALITLTNGDTITLDLNHNHPQYTKVQVCQDKAEYDAIVTKDPMTFYVIPQVALYLGSVLVLEQVSPLPYTPVPWIATDGTAYINTGIKGNSPMSAYCKMLPVAPASGTAYFFGHRSSTNGRFVFLMVGSNKYAGFTFGSSAFTTSVDISTSIDNQTPIEAKISLKTGDQNFWVRQEGDAQYTNDHDSLQTSVSDGIDILLFCYNNQGTPSTPQSGTRCYGAKIYSDADFGTMLFNGIPCYFNGEYGLWDLVSNSFFGNDAGSGAFTGPQI